MLTMSGSNSKRQRNDYDSNSNKKTRLSEEYERRMKALNRSFASWVEDNAEANLLSTWEDGVFDYIAYADNIRAELGTSGQLLTFGSGDCGQLGHGVDREKDLEVAQPRVVKRIQDKQVSAIECGGIHNALVVDGGQVWTFGCGDDGVLGRIGDENFPAPVPSLSKVVVSSLSAGDCHTAALSLSGDLYIWGAYKDRDGKNWFRSDPKGPSLKQNADTPMLVDELANGKHGGVIQVTSGAHHTLALCANGSVFSWGIGDAGQLGRRVCALKNSEDLYQCDDVRDDHLTPKPMQYKNLANVDGARFVAAGGYHSFVIKAMRSRVYACGLNQYGQLGLAPIPPESGDNIVERLCLVSSLDGKHVKVVDAGEHFSVALTCEGKLYSFGRADQRQLGVELLGDDLKPGAFKYEPQLVQGELIGKEVVAVSCGGSHTVAVTTEGKAYSWGFGVMYQLGHPLVKRNKADPSDEDEFEANDEPVPRRIDAKSLQGKFVTGVSAGGQHTGLLIKDA